MSDHDGGHHSDWDGSGDFSGSLLPFKLGWKIQLVGLVLIFCFVAAVLLFCGLAAKHLLDGPAPG